LRIERIYWYTWMGEDRRRDEPFDYAGLRSLRRNGSVRDKPAYHAFRRVAGRIDACRRGRISAACR